MFALLFSDQTALCCGPWVRLQPEDRPNRRNSSARCGGSPQGQQRRARDDALVDNLTTEACGDFGCSCVDEMTVRGKTAMKPTELAASGEETTRPISLKTQENA